MTEKSRKKTKKLVLLDVHAILHRAYHALPDFTSPKGEPTGALYGLVTMILKTIEELQPDFIIACYDLPQPNYRHHAYQAYKAGRAETDESLVSQIKRSKDIFSVFGIQVYEKAGYEADDLLGTLAKQGKGFSDLEIVIASGDMDTLQCVDKKRVRVYTLKKGIKDTTIYDEDAVKKRFGFSPVLVPDYKGLRGDPSDNIPGIPGIGEKTAQKLVSNFGSIESIYKKLKKDQAPFREIGVTPRIISLLLDHEEEAIFSKMLATIKNDVPITLEIPKHKWSDSVNMDELSVLFSDLGFRNLGARVVSVMGKAPKAKQMLSSEDERQVKLAGTMLWLLESERTNPTYQDIVDYGLAYFGTSNLSEIIYQLDISLKRHPKLYDLYNNVELPFLEVVDYLNSNGVKLDVKYLETVSKVSHKELDKLTQDIYKQAGVSFNINSPKQLGEVLFDKMQLHSKRLKKTAGGKRSTRESELEKMRDSHPIIGNILKYRELQKLLSTYVDNLPNMVSEDGRLRTTFLPNGTTTGRIASRDPNLQNIPNLNKGSVSIKRAFIAESENKLVALDYSQIELRISAVLSGDKNLIDIFKKGEDVHSGVAVRVFNVKPNEVTADMRRQAKVINFGILYGMGVNALMSALGSGTTRQEAQEFLNAYFNTFNTLANYLETVKEQARGCGYTETLFGRHRQFPALRSKVPFIRAQAERMAINAPIQGTAADLMRIAMNKVYKNIKNDNCLDKVKMLLQIHDELVFEVEEKYVVDYVPKIKTIMESVLPKEKSLGVPLLVDVKVGLNLEDMEKLIFE